MVCPQNHRGGLSVVWPQNHLDGFSQFSLKIDGHCFSRFGIKTGGFRFLGLGLKTGSYGLVILASKSPWWFLRGPQNHVGYGLSVEPQNRREDATAWDMHQDLAACFACVDVSYAAPQVHVIVNVALHREYSAGIVFIYSQGRKDL
jgi:hypothetical protein